MPRETREALDFLSQETWLRRSGWYLAGGTALALMAGHRSSVYLDFFLKNQHFPSRVSCGISETSSGGLLWPGRERYTANLPARK